MIASSIQNCPLMYRVRMNVDATIRISRNPPVVTHTGIRANHLGSWMSGTFGIPRVRGGAVTVAI